MSLQNCQREEIVQKINSCNTAINTHKKEIAHLDAEINILISELQKIESENLLPAKSVKKEN